MKFLKKEMKLVLANIKNQWYFFPIAVGVVLLSQFILIPTPFEIPNAFRLVTSVVAIGLYIILSELKNKKALAKNAVLAIIIFGALATINKPVLMEIDELAHLNTTIRLADGQVFTRENEDIPDIGRIFAYDLVRYPGAPEGMQLSWLQERHQPSTYSGLFTGINNLSYIPNAVGWAIGRALTGRVAVAYYLGRFFNILSFAALVAIAFKVGKGIQQLLFLMSNFPLTIWFLATYNYDAIYYGLSLIVIAYFSTFFTEGRKIKNADVFKFVGLNFLFTFPRFPFVVLGSFILFFPKSYYEKARTKLYGVLAFIGSLILATVFYFSSNILQVIQSVPGSDKDVSIGAHSLSYFYLFQHPTLILRNLFDLLYEIPHQFSNRSWYMSHQSNVLPTVTLILLVFLILLVSLSIRFSLPKKMKVLTTVVMFIITIGMIVAISSDPRVFTSGDLWVQGVQGRYFYFMVAFLPLLINERVKKLLSFDEKNELSAEARISFLQHSLFFLNILMIGVAMYALIPLRILE